MLFSVLVATYNGAKRVSTLIESLRKQDFKDFEVIFIDDHSEDETKKCIASYNDSRFVVFEKDGERGLNLSRQQAAIKAKGEYLIVMDDDDYVTDQYFSSLFKSIQTFYNSCSSLPDVVLTNVLIANECNNKIFIDNPKTYNLLSRNGSSKVLVTKKQFRNLLSLRYGSWQFVVKKSFLEKKRYSFSYGELTLFSLLFEEDCKVLYVPSAEYVYVQRKNSLSHDLLKSVKHNSKNSFNSTLKANPLLPSRRNGWKNRYITFYILKSMYPIYLIRGIEDKTFRETKIILRDLRKKLGYHFFSYLFLCKYFSSRTLPISLIIILRIERIAWSYLKLKYTKASRKAGKL